jgi:hypothetical protein
MDQHVASLEAREVKNELNDFKFSSPQQGVPKIEPESPIAYFGPFTCFVAVVVNARVTRAEEGQRVMFVV